MGKLKNKRHRLHVPVRRNNNQDPLQTKIEVTMPIVQPPENVFAGIHIDVNKINTKLEPDTLSVKSYKSTKSEVGSKITKKDKLSLRRKMLVQRISLMERSNKTKKRQRKAALTGDMNPLYDALPSLQSLLARKADRSLMSKKLRGIQSTAKRKKNLIEDIGVYKKLLKDENLKNDPLNKISEHVKAMVESQRLK